MSPSLPLLLAAAISQMSTAPAAEARRASCPAFVADDQFGTERRLSFPAAKPVLLFVADRAAFPQISSWPGEAKKTLGDAVVILGVAHLEGVSSLLAPMVKKKIRNEHQHPVLLDWKGVIGRFAGHEPGRVKIILLDSGGKIARTATSPITGEKIAALAAEARRLAERSADRATR